MRTAGPKYLSAFHQYDGHDVEQHAHKMHSYNPSNWARSSTSCKYWASPFFSLPLSNEKNEKCKCQWSPSHHWITQHLLALQPRLNGRVLIVEIAHVRHQISHHIHMRQRIDFTRFTHIRIDATNTGQRIRATNIHRTRTANTFTARSAERQRWIHFILNFQQCVQHHRRTIVQIQLILLHVRLLIGLVRTPAINFECFDARLFLWRWLSCCCSSSRRWCWRCVRNQTYLQNKIFKFDNLNSFSFLARKKCCAKWNENSVSFWRHRNCSYEISFRICHDNNGGYAITARSLITNESNEITENRPLPDWKDLAWPVVDVLPLPMPFSRLQINRFRIVKNEIRKI